MQQTFWGFSDPMKVNYPGDTDRLVIVGTTGSGKTHAALWHLSRRNYDEKPWIVYDWKRDDFIGSLPYAIEMSVHSEIPEGPGIYVVRPDPEDDDDYVEAQMNAIWRREDVGVYIDEGYMVDTKNKAFRKLLTQGRSKHIPMIILSQRPVWMDKFVFTESGFKQVFRLESDDDMAKMAGYIPPLRDRFRRNGYQWDLPKLHSYYYDSIEGDMRTMKPVPDQDAIRAVFEQRLKPIAERRKI